MTEENMVDELYLEAVAKIKGSNDDGLYVVTLLQLEYHIGYNRAARMVEAMEQQGIVGPMDNFGRRKVLVRSSITN